MESEYLEFREEITSNKTKRWNIYSKSSGDTLGTIKWYGAWRQYCFFPENTSTIWNKGCLEDVIKFIGVHKNERNVVK